MATNTARNTKRIQDSLRIKQIFVKHIVSELTIIEWRTVSQLWLESPDVRSSYNPYVAFEEVINLLETEMVIECSKHPNPKFNEYRLVQDQ